MPVGETSPLGAANEAVPDRPPQARELPAAAKRALAEAAARSAQSPGTKAEQPKEVGGRDGPEPTRYGDWEINGLASDF
jgi:hypothetical protein